MERGPQPEDRNPLGQCRRCSQTRGRTGRARTRRPPGCDRYRNRGAVAAGDENHSDRVRDCHRSGRLRFRRELGTSGRQRDRLHHLRIQHEREMAGAAQGDRARRDASGGASRSGRRVGNRAVRRGADRRAGIGRAVDSARRARCRGNRARRGGIRNRVEWRPDRDWKRIGDRPSRADRQSGGTAQAARGLSRPFLRHQRRPDLLRSRSRRPVPARGRLRRSHPQGREACRSASAGADQVRARDQPQDRQGARPRRPADAARPRRRGDRMRRREFIALFGSASAAPSLLWPLAAGAQRPRKVPLIGVLLAGTPASFSLRAQAFRNGLHDLGYVEGKTIAIEWKWGYDRVEGLPGLAAELVGLNVDVIVTGGTPAAKALKNATQTIPIIMAIIGDPVAAGLVDSLARPGGNATGFSIVAPELSGKRLQLLKEIVPGIPAVAVMSNVSNPQSLIELSEMQVAAQTLDLQLYSIQISAESSLEDAFEKLSKQSIQAWMVLTDPILYSQRSRIVALAARKRLPAMYFFLEFVQYVGLMR